MIKTLTTLVFCFLLNLAHAQLQLLRNEMLNYGAVMTFRAPTNYSVIDTTIQGANVVWNFSALKKDASADDYIIKIMNPASTPHPTSFPSSNYAYKETYGTDISYRYFTLTNSKMERVGSFDPDMNTFDDPQVEYVFPLALGTSNDDTWEYTTSLFTGDYNLKCLGTGKLTLPGGNVYNALMVRVYHFDGFIPEIIFYWYSADNGAMLLYYWPGDDLLIEEDAGFLTSLTTDVDEINSLGLEYNNPVKNNFFLSFRSNDNAVYHCDLANTLGQNLFNGNTENESGNKATLNIDFSNFPTGVYFLTIKSEGSDRTAKTIKIVKP